MDFKFNVLIYSDSTTIISKLVSVLEEYKANYDIARSDIDVEKKLLNKGYNYDIVFTEYFQKDFIEKLASKYNLLIAIFTPIIDDKILNLISSGINEVITIPIEQNRIRIFLERARFTIKLKKEVQIYSSYKDIQRVFKGYLSNDPEMRELLLIAQKVAKTNATVLITGETGVGKEVFARLIHDLSNADKEKFVAINCSSIPENLLESELFGHEKGSFTGAYSQKKGLFEIANNGTLLLDEIGDMPLLLQSKLLRVLEERTIRRIGGTKIIPVNFRLIAATNKNLELLVNQGRFRQDLFYRLNVFHIYIPPLRERKTEIISLSYYFIEIFNNEYHKNIKHLSEKATMKLLSYNFPGNVRELKHIIEKAVILTNGQVITDKQILLPTKNINTFDEPESNADNLNVNIEQPMKQVVDYWVSEIRKEYLKNLIKKYGNNVKLITKIAKIERSYFYKMLKKYNIVDYYSTVRNFFPHSKKD